MSTQEDEKLKKIFQSVKLKEAPQGFLRNFTESVQDKIQSRPRLKLSWGWVPLAAFAVILLALYSFKGMSGFSPLQPEAEHFSWQIAETEPSIEEDANLLEELGEWHNGALDDESVVEELEFLDQVEPPNA